MLLRYLNFRSFAFNLASNTPTSSRHRGMLIGVTVNINKSLYKLPSTYLQGNTYSSVIIPQELFTPGDRFFPDKRVLLCKISTP